jgi:hypothetical protein
MFICMHTSTTKKCVDVVDMYLNIKYLLNYFFFGATAPIRALAYLHETLRFVSVF